ncbi:MAG: hypothetical protein PVG49_05665 [Desulfobacteraceae bacterium]
MQRPDIRALEERVQNQFGTSLNGFMRKMIEERALFDYQVAEMLHIKPATVGFLRRDLGLKRDGFKQRFEKRYGPGSVEAFRELSSRPETALKDIARRFGFSRQYAWVIFEKICGKPYSDAFQKKRRLRRQEKQRKVREKHFRSKKLRGFLKIEKELKERGIPARLVRQGKRYVLVTRRSTLNLKYTKTAVTIGNRQYFKFVNVGCRDSDCDFYICRCRDLERSIHYIIPKEAMPASTISLPPQSHSEQSKYGKFLEAWHLLEENPQKRQAG